MHGRFQCMRVYADSIYKYIYAPGRLWENAPFFDQKRSRQGCLGPPSTFSGCRGKREASSGVWNPAYVFFLCFVLQVHHINANYFLDITSMKPEEVESSIFGFSSSFEDPSTATYLQFLKEGLQKAKPHL